MEKEENLQISFPQNKQSFSPVFQIAFIAISFIALIFSRILTQSFDVFLDSLYILCIALAGLWFGLRGGILASLLSCTIFILEINVFNYFPAVGLATKTMVPRLILYFFSGIGLGYFSDREKTFKKQLENLARYDYLTACYNMRYTMEILENEVARSRRYGKNISLAMIDIDYFKDINDTYGHLVGNEVIKAIGAIIKKNLRGVDVVGRYGGDEFLVIFPEMHSNSASYALKRIAIELSLIRIISPYSKGEIEIPIKFSAGIVSFPENGRNAEELLSMADFAVYKAKKKGRSCIVVEKRKWLRFEPNEDLKIEIKTPENKKPAKCLKIIDISQAGMRIILNRDIEDDNFTAKFLFPKNTSSEDIICEIKHKIKLENGKVQVGIYFVNIDETTQKIMFNYAKDLSEIEKI